MLIKFQRISSLKVNRKQNQYYLLINNYVISLQSFSHFVTRVRMAAYPIIRQMFIDLNTGLPASAAVERLFSLGGRVFTPLRTCLSSHHFEMMMFLRLSKRF